MPGWEAPPARSSDRKWNSDKPFPVRWPDAFGFAVTRGDGPCYVTSRDRATSRDAVLCFEMATRRISETTQDDLPMQWRFVTPKKSSCLLQNFTAFSRGLRHVT